MLTTNRVESPCFLSFLFLFGFECLFVFYFVGATQLSNNEAVTALDWLTDFPSTLVVGTGFKWLRLYDVRQSVTSSALASASAATASSSSSSLLATSSAAAAPASPKLPQSASSLTSSSASLPLPSQQQPQQQQQQHQPVSVIAHARAVQSVCVDPFYGWRLATCSDDGNID